MKQIALMMLLITLTTSVNATPSWVPADKKKDYDFVMKKAAEYSEVLRSKPKVTKVEKEGEWIVITTKRGKIITEIWVGKFKSVTDWDFENNKVVIKYVDKEADGGITVSEVVWGAVGFLLGAFFTFLANGGGK